MTARDLHKAYDPKGVEERWYAFWLEKDYFRGRPGGPDEEPFCIVIPPPNITGALHIGHALNNTLQDILVRRARMQGRPTLWVPGTDHAAIATQNVLERRLAEEGLTRFDLGREEFEKRFWQWKEEYEARIIGQLQRLGCSCDWSRTRFTMDPGLSRAVRTVFVRLYEEGRIYRGNRIINWCPRCTSSLSDLEVKHEEKAGELIRVRYPLADGSGHIAVATTRVETMLGDTGVAVHPADERYRHVVGKRAVLPLVGRELPIVADEAVDPEFGTGAVKVTPAHDPVDFEIAERHGLPAVNIFTEQAVVNEHGGRFAGLDRYQARQAVLEALRAGGYVEREDRPYVHAVGHCDRCDTEVEPWLSEQWFVATKELAAPAIEAVLSGRVQLHPRQPFEKMYLDWMRNIRDWCISRQIWLGHRIPVWYCPQGHRTVAVEDPEACATCGTREIEQDPDTLDTWFSSQLWPFSTLGWPDDTEDLRYWYPTTVLSTAPEILYLWVARMIMAGLHFMGEVPFRHVVIHPIVRDWEGKKMSKSRGNVIDPLDIIERYGTDALRLSLAAGAVPGLDMNLSEERIERARNFCNKLWNAARFVLQHLEGFTPGPLPQGLGLPERWILSRLAQTHEAVDGALEAFEFSEAARAIQQFIWSEYCDWYVEMAKVRLRHQDQAPAVRAVLYHCLEVALRLAHPIMPFITEEIWQRLPRGEGGPESIMVAPWPAERGPIDAGAEEQMAFLQDLVVEVRRFRHDHKIPPQQRLEAVVVAPEAGRAVVEHHREEVEALGRLTNLTTAPQAPGPGWSRVVAGQAEVYLPLAGVIDLAAEQARLSKDIAKLQERARRVAAKLENPQFTGKAPAEVVSKVRSELEGLESRIARLRSQLEELAGGA